MVMKCIALLSWRLYNYTVTQLLLVCEKKSDTCYSNKIVQLYCNRRKLGRTTRVYLKLCQCGT